MPDPEACADDPDDCAVDTAQPFLNEATGAVYAVGGYKAIVCPPLSHPIGLCWIVL